MKTQKEQALYHLQNFINGAEKAATNLSEKNEIQSAYHQGRADGIKDVLSLVEKILSETVIS